MPDSYLALHPNVVLPSAYSYQEYPKWVMSSDGKTVLVHSSRQEAEETGQEVAEPEAGETANALFASYAAPDAAEPVNEKALLQLEASNMGIEVDRRWGIKKLRAEIEAAR